MKLSIIETHRKQGRFPDKPVFLLQQDGSSEFCVFATRISAEKAKRELESGKARWCECGQWVKYSGGQECPQCIQS